MTHIVISPASGGIAYVARNLFTFWASNGDDVRLIQIDQTGELHVDEQLADSARVTRVALTAFRSAWRVRRDLRRSHSLHVELGRGSLATFWFALGAALYAPRAHMLVVIHDPPVVVRHPSAGLFCKTGRVRSFLVYRIVCPLLDRVFISMLRRYAKATVVLSESAADVVRADRWPRVTWVPLGADPYSENAAPPSAPGAIVLAGYLGPGKGLDVLAEAWQRIDTDLQLIIAGGFQASDREFVEAARSLLDNSHHPPTWTGYLDDTAFDRAIRNAAIILIPYEISNAASGILVRAMADGRAIIATRVPATAGEIEDGISGLLVEPGDPIQLAAALRILIDSPATRDRLGASAARVAAGRHTWSSHANGVSALRSSVEV